MNRKITLGGLPVVGLLVLALIAGAGGDRPLQAQEQAVVTGTGTAEGTAPEGGETRAKEKEPELVSAYLRIPGTALKPRASTVEWADGGQGGGIYATSGDTYQWFNAGVYLPQGSTVTMLRVYVNDTNASNNCSAYFTVYDLWADINQEWGSTSAGIDGENWFDIDIPDEVIDYGTYSYVVNWSPRELGDDMVLYGFRIYYTPPGGKAYMPSIQNDAP